MARQRINGCHLVTICISGSFIDGDVDRCGIRSVLLGGDFVTLTPALLFASWTKHKF